MSQKTSDWGIIATLLCMNRIFLYALYFRAQTVVRHISPFYSPTHTHTHCEFKMINNNC